jgi:tRNA(Ile)-lysidine synthase
MKLPFGTKKIKSLFIDLKIPIKQRDSLPLVLLDEEIIWIPGVKKKTMEGSKHIYINYRKGDYYG